MTAAWLLSWWNLIFIVPFGLALVYLGLYTMTGLGGDHDADAHGDVGHDVDADADADAHIDAEHDLHSTEMHDGHGGSHGHDHGHPAQREVSLHATLLNLVGVGRAPLGVIVMILLMAWGIIGFSINQLIRPIVPAEWMVGLASLPIAALGSMAITGGFARLIARVLPTTATTAHKRRELCGRVGEAMYEITSSFGVAVVRDRDGNHFQLPCRVSGDRPPIAKGDPVLLVRYDAETNMFDVIPDELGLVARAGKGPALGTAERTTEQTAELSKERDRVSQ